MQTRAQDQGLPKTLVAYNFIGGREESGDDTFSRNNPANAHDVVCVAPQSSAASVQRACEAARQMAKSWARVPSPQRAQVLTRLARLLSDNKESLARFVAREVGKPIREARGSVQEAIDTAEFFQSEGRRLYGQTVPSELPSKELFTYRRPLGVVAVITAGNFPIAVPSWKIIPALLCGNTVVWKPSDDAPGTATLFLELWRRAGLPDGVLNLVHGGGAAAAGEFLTQQVEQGRVDKLSFTGSTRVGRQLGAICGRALQVPSLELGGKNPLVILADANLELAIEGALWASFGTAGQRCTSAGNLIVDERVLPTVRAELVRRASALKIGDPLDESVDYGPLINERFLRSWQEQRDVGLAEGAALLLDGQRVSSTELPASFAGDAERGLFVTPRIFDQVTMSQRIAQKSALGPRSTWWR